MAIFGLTLVRHGETNCNRQSITQGQKDTELSEQGIGQAKLLGQRLQYEKFTHIFCSDLQRALKTCEIILQENKVCPTPIKQDKRLRERKFGVFEGQPSSHLIKAARKARSNISSYVPEGGESSLEVQTRAKAFFTDLCQSLQQDHDNNCLGEVPAAAVAGPGNIKRRRNTSTSTVDQVFPDTPPAAVATDNTSSQQQQQHMTSSSTSSSACSSGCTDVAAAAAGDSPQPDAATAAISQAPGEKTSSQHTAAAPSRDLQHNCLLLPSPSQPIPFYDGGGGSQMAGDGQLGGCPNVSLSPIFEHRPSTMSSVSSGRNSSFDDGDMIPMPLADILIVTHGGLIRELIRYFVNTLGCQIPGGKGYTQNVSPNTGISKFTVTLGESENEPPRLTCLTIHDKDHLQSCATAPVSSIYEQAAL